MQGGGAGAGASAAVHEWFNASTGDQPAEQTAVVDGAFLMDLLEDTPAAEQAPDDVDRLSHVIRTLEAEISGGGRAAPLAPADGGSMLEHVPAGDVGSEGLEEECALSDDLYSAPGPCVAEVPFEYCWTEVPPAVGHDMGGWYSGTSTAMASWWGTSSGSSATTATMTAHTLSVCTAPCGNE